LNNLNTSFWYRPGAKRFKLHAQYHSQTNVESHNGGVSDHTLYKVAGYELRSLIPVHLGGAYTRFQQRKYLLDIFYELTKASSSRTFKPFLHMTSEFENLLYKFYDENIESEYDFYGDQFASYSGLRHFIQRNLLKNKVQINIPLKESWNITAGLSHHLHFIHQEPVEKRINDLYLTGKIKLKFLHRFDIYANGHLGALDALGEYALQAKLNTDLAKIGNLEIELINQNKRPALIENQLFINQSGLRDNNFSLFNETRLSFLYHNQTLGFTAGYAQQFIHNAIYFDADKQVHQYDKPYLLSQIHIHEDLSLKWFHFNNAVFYQLQNSRIYPLPNLYTLHSIYVRRNLFKSVMDFKGGLDLRYIFDYKPPAFDPVTSAFYLQEDFIAEAYPALDIFVEGKVDNFALFIKVENILSPVLNEQFFLIKDNPQFDLKLRLGFVWQLWN